MSICDVYDFVMTQILKRYECSADSARFGKDCTNMVILIQLRYTKM